LPFRKRLQQEDGNSSANNSANNLNNNNNSQNFPNFQNKNNKNSDDERLSENEENNEDVEEEEENEISRLKKEKAKRKKQKNQKTKNEKNEIINNEITENENNNNNNIEPELNLDDDLSLSEDGENDYTGKKVYCICRRPDSGKWMIMCDKCQEWYHGSCVGISQQIGEKLEEYQCRSCLADEIKEALFKKCSNECCANFVRPYSKYCSNYCGVKVQKLKLIEQSKLEKEKEDEDFFGGSAKDKSNFVSPFDKIELEQLNEKKKKLEKEIVDINDQLTIYRQHMEKSRNIQENKSIVFQDEPSATAQDLLCRTCGHQIPLSGYSRHIEVCFVKHTSRETVKESESIVCACPTSEFVSGYCERLTKNCTKHINWTSLLESRLFQQKRNKISILHQCEADIGFVERRIKRRDIIR